MEYGKIFIASVYTWDQIILSYLLISKGMLVWLYFQSHSWLSVTGVMHSL